MPTAKPEPVEEPKIERWTAQRKAAIILDVTSINLPSLPGPHPLSLPRFGGRVLNSLQSRLSLQTNSAGTTF
jgi:hypothetical protein